MTEPPTFIRPPVSRTRRAFKWIALGLAAMVGLSVIVSALASSGSLTANVPDGATAGTFEATCVEGGLFDECDDKDAGKEIRAVEAWCRWDGSKVMVHVRLENNFGAKVEASISPRYVIENGGQHGTSFGSDREVVIAPGKEADLDIDAGHPKGVPDGTQISECTPRLENVRLVN